MPNVATEKPQGKNPNPPNEGQPQKNQPELVHITKTDLDHSQLARELADAITGEVRFDAGSRALYATDGSNYRMPPIGVVIPRTVDDVVKTVAIASRHDAPLLSRGGGTSLAGQCCNSAIVMDWTKYLHNLVKIDAREQWALVQPGLVLDDLRDATREYTLTFGPDPATHNRCTLGGMMGNNSCGVHALMAGKTSENVIAMEVLTYDGLRMWVGETSETELEQIIGQGGRRGEIYRSLRDLRDKYGELIRAKFPQIPRRVSGYNLDELLPENDFNVAKALVGSEGTCVTILQAKVRLVYSPPKRALVVLGFKNIYEAADAVPKLLNFGMIGLEGIDHLLFENIKKKGLHPKYLEYLPEGKGWLLCEFGGATQQAADAHAAHFMNAVTAWPDGPSAKFYDDRDQEEKIWKVRESGLGATARVPGEPDTWEGWEDSAVPPARLGDYLRDLCSLYEKYGYIGALYGHFGQGCVHTRITFDLASDKGVKKYRDFVTEAAHLVVSYGGSLSGEHGDGQSRGELLPIMFGHELVEAFREFKSIWDPRGKMNPGKVVNANPVDSFLRLGADYSPWEPKTHFQFPNDDGKFARATLRCVGVGECRREHTGTMCPSYMVTREEMHSTRGRAHLLWEMTKGETIAPDWKNDSIKEALDLCLACKGCKGDCPVNVDVATYKAEFLSHYYEGRIRPRSAYAFGFINKWAQLASVAPSLVNFFTQTPPFNIFAKLAAGMPQQRRIPPFASEPFRAWWQREHKPANLGAAKVILWVDTFNNYFHPEVAQAAVEVLEAAGFHVDIPEQEVCCGRPLYDFGFLDEAKVYIHRILEVMRPQIAAGLPIVALEPSCQSVLVDEAYELFPKDPYINKLKSNVFTLAKFLQEKAEGFTPPKLHRKAIVHGHCHHKSVLKFESEPELFKEMEMDTNVLDSGCCGMAGSFGFESDKYEVSIAVGERVLLPAVRNAGNDELIVADGFSCREQVQQTTRRRALHTAQVLQMALREGPDGPGTTRPEDNYALERSSPAGNLLLLGALGVAAAGALYLLAGTRRKS
jgi:FAD/FMN-containing dehydrogenase/Fe-S oxidoreductase